MVIEVYDYNNLYTRIASLPVLSGSETRTLDSVHTLTAEVLPSMLKKLNLAITPSTVYKVGGIFYRSSAFTAVDAETGTISINADDLLSADLTGMVIIELVGKMTLSDALFALLSDTRFVIGICDVAGTYDVNLTNINRYAALLKLLEIFGGEIERVGLTINVLTAVRYEKKLTFIKGKNLQSIEEINDWSRVLTRLYYTDTSGEEPVTKSLDSPYAAIYPPKEEHKTFNSEAMLNAANYLAAYSEPQKSYRCTIPPMFADGLDVGTPARLVCQRLNLDAEYRVIEITRDLTGQNAVDVVFGSRPARFSEFIADIFVSGGVSETQLDKKIDDMKKGVKSDLELVIPELVNETFKEFDFLDPSKLFENEEFIENLTAAIEENGGIADVDTLFSDEVFLGKLSDAIMLGIDGAGIGGSGVIIERRI